MRSASSPRDPEEPASASRLLKVGRHDRRERKEARDQRVDGVVLQELRTRARDHDRIDDHRDISAGEEVRDHVDQLTREEHPGLRNVHADVVEDSLQLRPHEVGEAS